jgi:pilus assembly protein CpaF
MSILRRIQNGDQQQGPASTDNASASNSVMQSKRPLNVGNQASQDTYQDLKGRVQKKLISELDPSVDVSQVAEVKKTILDLFEQILVEENFVLSRTEKTRLFEQISAEILGLGPLQPLLEDDTITEVMVRRAST